MTARLSTAPPDRVVPTPAPRLRPWSRLWRYLVAVGLGLVVLFGNLTELLGQDPAALSEEANVVIGGFVLLDLLLGVVAVCLLSLRRRFPVLTAVLTACLSAISVFAVGSAALAIVSMSTRRRWKPVVAVGFVWVAATAFYELVLRPSIPGMMVDSALSWASGGLAIAIYAICATTGFYIGARRDLLASLRDRAETAEREQALREESARESERTRIAREMHDVLAHHISLLSLHAGVLTYRTDLTRQETVDAATIIQSNAQLALTELRQILGVLRSRDGEGAGDGSGLAEPPQPTLAELPALLADSREGGMRVSLDASGLGDEAMTIAGADRAVSAPEGGRAEFEGLSESVSRAAYRIIQEALTNARKHAAGAPVTLEIDRRGGELLVAVRNPLRGSPAVSSMSSGMGLTGLRERAELAGGSLAHGADRDGGFIVTARLPWQ
ncbi:sensor histidine kinase [Cryobacterium arcticum]|uniref:sensor histidine kinase n=1 Tax=Cryobacterium arcticum TaxID=670052 RepID=UPI002006F234|nr:histidine kinase [Cryobacterium arcticum]